MSDSFSKIKMPCIMGILNVTPDSFSDGGQFYAEGQTCPNSQATEKYLLNLVAEGAKIIDIGGESTRPKAQPIDHSTEWLRIKDIIRTAVKIDGISVSVDTYHPKTANLALKHGVNIINDVCGTDHFQEMAQIIKDFNAHLIVTHNSRSDDNFKKISEPIPAIIASFEKILEQSQKINLDADRIILDPGIGFGKTSEQNLKIFKNIGHICDKFPNIVVCATSRKSFFNLPADNQALDAATAATTFEAYRQGCKIFRVHNVAANLISLNLAQKIYER